MSSSRLWVAPATLATLLIAACGSATSPPPITTPSPSVPVASLTPSTSPVPLPSPSGPVPATLRWEPIGVIPERGANGIVSFDGGYVAYGETDDQKRPVAWFSADGRDWASVQLAGTVPCGSNPEPAATVRHGASNGPQVVLVGSEWPEGSQPCDGSNSRNTRPVAWITSDGREWQRSDPMQTSLVDDWPTAHIVWAIPGGWEAAIGDARGPNFIWQSLGGRMWRQVAEMDYGEDARLVAAAANPDDGRRLMLVGPTYVHGAIAYLLLTSGDGSTWDEVAHPVGDGWGQYWILPGSPRTQDPWLVITGDAASTVVSTSFDLDVWGQKLVPMPAVAALARTRYGLLAIGWSPEPVDLPSDYTTYLSADGLTWTRLESDVNLHSITDGPAGVLGLAWNGEQATVWRLVDTPLALVPSSAPTRIH